MILFPLHGHKTNELTRNDTRFFKSRMLVLLSLGLLLFSFFLPAIVPAGAYQPPVNGISCFLLGPFCLLRLFLLPFFCWLPNACYLAAFVLWYRKLCTKGIWIILAGLLLSCFLIVLPSLPFDEAGNRYPFHLGPAYYIWIAAQCFLLLQLLVNKK